MLRATACTLVLAGLTTAASAQVSPVATETFEYPVPGLIQNMAGGTGWSNAWFITGAANDEIVMFDNTITPPFALSDGVGGHAGQANVFGQGYRRIDVGAHPDIANGNGKIGADGATVWISFSSVNYQGQPMEHFGGLSLFNVGVGEEIFLGSPWDTNEWGIDDEGPNGAPPVTVAGASDTVASRLVYRIDFQAGDERLRLYVNPAVPHPTGAADLDTPIADLEFDEISIASGGNNGDSYFWDNIVFEKGVSGGAIGTNYCTANPNSTGVTASISATGSAVAADNDVTLNATNVPNQAFGFFLTSLSQDQVANPGGSAGNLCLGGAIGRYVGPGQVQNSGAAGEFSLVLDLTQTPQPNGLVTIVAGETWNFQAWHRDSSPSGPTSNLTDGTSVLFQ